MPAGLTPTTRFSDRVGDYARHRPSYPGAAIDALLDGLGPRESLVVADIGAGTGISTRLLAGAPDGGGPRVIAVEPNEAMRCAGESEPHPRIEWRAGTGEVTGLPDASIHAILCAQAFHWLDPDKALTEFRRILRSGGGDSRGRVGLMWNTRNPDDPATEAYYATMAAHAVEGPRSPWASNDVNDNRYAIPLRDSSLFRNYRAPRFGNAQRLDRAGFLGRAMSASYIPKEGDAGRRVRDDLDNVFDRHSQRAPSGEQEIVLRYTVELHLAERAP